MHFINKKEENPTIKRRGRGNWGAWQGYAVVLTWCDRGLLSSSEFNSVGIKVSTRVSFVACY